MPVIIDPADFDVWLDTSAGPEAAQALLKPYPARLTSLSPGVLADSERRSDSQGAQNGAKSPQDGGRGSSIWEITA
jgi:putative SOS response-associated peptidase YedK